MIEMKYENLGLFVQGFVGKRNVSMMIDTGES